jgi:hypothetical protein
MRARSSPILKLAAILAGASAATLKPTDVAALTATDAPAFEVQVPRASTTLSLLAERRKSIARQMTQLQAQKYKAANNATYAAALAEAEKRLQKTKKECDDCQAAEEDLQAAYAASLKAHKYVEDVEGDLLKLSTAERALDAAMTAKEKAEKEYLQANETVVLYETNEFEPVKKDFMKKAAAWTCGDESTVGSFRPLVQPGDMAFSLQTELDRMNAAAKTLRGLKEKVPPKKKVFEAKKVLVKEAKAAWEAAKQASIARALCAATAPAVEAYCVPADVESAKSASAAKDAVVEAKKAIKVKECAAIPQEKWGTPEPTNNFLQTISAVAPANLWAAFDADELVGLKQHAKVTSWTNIQGNPEKNVKIAYASDSVYYKPNGISGKPSVCFNRGELVSDTSLPTPAHGEVTVVISFKYDSSNGARHWQQLIGQGHDQYWVVRQYSGSKVATMHIMNSNAPSAKWEFGQEYIVVARTSGGRRDVTTYAISDLSVVGTDARNDGNRLRSMTNSALWGTQSTRLSLGWSTARKSNEPFSGCMRQIAVYDKRLTDAQVQQVLQSFKS